MGIKIASFNVHDLSAYKPRDLDRIARIIKDNGFAIVALQEILSEGKILTGAKVSDLHGQAKAYDMSLKSRLGTHWASVWRDPESKAKMSTGRGLDKRGEGYAFLWDTRIVELPKKADNTSISPYIEHNYKIRGQNADRLIRDPCVGRFKIIERPVEIRLINTHIIYGNQNEIGKRKNEFSILAGEIYRRVNSSHRDTASVVYTVVLGDYNLNLQGSGIGNPSENLPSVMVFDQKGCVIPVSTGVSSDSDHSIYTLQKSPTTLKKEAPYYVSNYDHFSMDDHTKAQVGGAYAVDAVRQTADAIDAEGDELFGRYIDTVSDHIPIVIELNV